MTPTPPRTPESLVAEMLGGQALAICRLQAQLEAATARIEELTMLLSACQARVKELEVSRKDNGDGRPG